MAILNLPPHDPPMQYPLISTHAPDQDMVKAAAKQALRKAQLAIAMEEMRKKAAAADPLANKEPMTKEELEEYRSQFETMRDFEDDDEWDHAYTNKPCENTPPHALTSPGARAAYHTTPTKPSISTLNSNATVFSPRKHDHTPSAAAAARAAPYGVIGSRRPTDPSASPVKKSTLKPTAPKWDFRPPQATSALSNATMPQPAEPQSLHQQLLERSEIHGRHDEAVRQGLEQDRVSRGTTGGRGREEIERSFAGARIDYDNKVWKK